jgi:hypothetical protein
MCFRERVERGDLRVCLCDTERDKKREDIPQRERDGICGREKERVESRESKRGL